MVAEDLYKMVLGNLFEIWVYRNLCIVHLVSLMVYGTPGIIMIHLVWMEVTNCHGGSNASEQAGGRSEIPIKQQKKL